MLRVTYSAFTGPLLKLRQIIAFKNNEEDNDGFQDP